MSFRRDELYTFIGSKSRPTWLFATIEVCSRLWAGSVGRRSYRNTKAVLNDVILRGRLVGFPLIATDGFEYYFAVIVRLMVLVAARSKNGCLINSEQRKHRLTP